MLEYDFLKIINDYVRVYKEFPLPAIICDADFQVYWSNVLARNCYPEITESQGLAKILSEFDEKEIILAIKRNGNCTISDAIPLSGVHLNLQPIFADGEMAGFVLLLLTSSLLPDSKGLFLSTRTASTLNENIRQYVGDIFETMDATAFKADLIQAGWIKPSLNRISLDSYRILRTVENIATYARFQSGTLALDYTAVDLFAILSEISSAVEGMSQAVGIPVEFDIPKEASLVQIDVELFELAFYGLLHNSLYFTRAGNHVRVTAAVTGGLATVGIHDCGVGIPAHIREDIWRPYYTYSTSGKERGVGLGLTLAKAIIEAHGGSIELVSIEGQGASVTLRMPMRQLSQPIPLGQEIPDSGRLSDRFSRMHTGLTDAVLSPYREES